MVLAFKPQFVEPIISGKKIHTIRQDIPDRWKSGNIIHFATGVRTPNYNQFHFGKCVSIQTIKLMLNWTSKSIIIDGKIANHQVADLLAKNDGFKNFSEMGEFFKWKDFTGKIIHWTDFKYQDVWKIPKA